MQREILAGDLKRALQNVPDDIPVRLSSDTGVDQGDGQIIVLDAYEVKYDETHYFAIYANDVDDEEDYSEDGAAELEDSKRFLQLMRQAEALGITE
ncbi:MAG: hypothetical protein J6A59_07490 [Lachnospiraceae bacterium]|nr:hypothetical protein [Lachnospiraceae bacterium]